MDFDLKKEIIESVMPVGIDMTVAEVSKKTKEVRFLTVGEVTDMFYMMDNVKYHKAVCKTLKVAVEAYDEEGPILDDNGDVVVEFIKRRKEYRYWKRSD